MRRFLHEERRQLEVFLTDCREFGAVYRAGDFGLDDRLVPWLAELEDYFANHPLGSKATATISRLQNYLHTARRGIDPLSLEKLRTGKRAMLASSIFQLLNEVTELLIAKLEEVTSALEEGGQLLEQTLLSALQAGFVLEHQLNKAAASPKASGELWEYLRSSEELSTICQRILLHVSLADVQMLLLEMVTIIRQ